MSKERDPEELARAEFNSRVENEYDLIRNGRKSVRDLPRGDEISDAVISRMVSERPGSFADLAPDQFTEFGAYLYIRECLKKTDTVGKQKLYYTTFDGHTALYLPYTTAEDDVIEYIDPELEIPSWLMVKASLRVTLDNALDLLRALDIDVHLFNMERLVFAIHDKLTNILRRELLAYIDENKLGFFGFEAEYGKMAERVGTALNDELAVMGMHVTEFMIRKIYMSEEIAGMVRREYFTARTMSIRAEAEEKWAESSTRMLEKKASVIQNYKMPEDTLTEMEKDKALERHLRKVNNIMESVDYRGDRPCGVGMLFEHTRPACPVEPPMVKLWQIVLCIIVASGLAIGSGIVIMSRLYAVFAAMAVVTVGFIVLAVVLIVRRFAERGIRMDYEIKMRDYGHELEEYEISRREAAARRAAQNAQ